MKLLVIEQEGKPMGATQMLRLEEAAPGLDVELNAASSLTPDSVARAEVIYGFIPPALLQHTKSLRWLHLPSAGAERYADLSLYHNRDIMLTNSAGVYGIPIAEHSLYMMLRLCRLPPDLMELQGSTVLLLGLGNIGQTLASRLRAFDCRIWGVRSNILLKPDFVDEVYLLSQLHELLPHADFVVMSLPLTADTMSVMDADAFARMKPGSVFINVGRGATVDTDALVRALESGVLRGAGLDVTEPEPLPDGHPLRGMPNVVLTPHIAGLSPITRERGFALFYDLLSRYTSGRRLYNQVDFFKGY